MRIGQGRENLAVNYIDSFSIQLRVPRGKSSRLYRIGGMEAMLISFYEDDTEKLRRWWNTIVQRNKYRIGLNKIITSW